MDITQLRPVLSSLTSECISPKMGSLEIMELLLEFIDATGIHALKIWKNCYECIDPEK